MRIERPYFKKKIKRMRILNARIFSKSFGGKIKHGQTDVNKETTFTEKMTCNTGFKNVL